MAVHFKLSLTSLNFCDKNTLTKSLNGRIDYNPNVYTVCWGGAEWWQEQEPPDHIVSPLGLWERDQDTRQWTKPRLTPGSLFSLAWLHHLKNVGGDSSFVSQPPIPPKKFTQKLY